MRFLGTADIALRAEKTALEENIQKAEMSGAAKRDPNSVAQMRDRLARIYGRLDPARATREQIKANQTRRFNPTMGDYDPLQMNLETAMALVDRKYGNTPGYEKARNQVKYSIQNQLSSPTPIDAISIAGRARDELAKATQKDPGGAKGASLSARRDLVDAQKTKASDLEGMTDPFDVAMTLMDLQKQGGMDRPVGGGMANRPNISPYGNSIPAQAMAAAGMVTQQMRPSESIPSTKGVLGEDVGAQVDAFTKSLAGMFDPATLTTPISGAADMANMAFQSLDPSTRKEVEKQLVGATPEERKTFVARMLGMLAGGWIQGKVIHGLPKGMEQVLNIIENEKIRKNLGGLNTAADASAYRPQPELPPPSRSLKSPGSTNPGSGAPSAPAASTASDVSNVKVSFRPKPGAEPAVDPSGVKVSFRPKSGAEPAPPAAPPTKTGFKPGDVVEVPKKNGTTVQAVVTHADDVSVEIQTKGGTKKAYSPEDANTVLRPVEQPTAKAPDAPVATDLSAPVTAPEVAVPDGVPKGKAKNTPKTQPQKAPEPPATTEVIDRGGSSQPDFTPGERVIMPYNGKNGATSVEAVVTAVTPEGVTVKIKGGKTETLPPIMAKAGLRRIVTSPEPAKPTGTVNNFGGWNDAKPKGEPPMAPATKPSVAPDASAPKMGTEPTKPVAAPPEPTKAPEVAPKSTTPISPDEPRSYVTVNGEQYVVTGETHRRYQQARAKYERATERIKSVGGLISREQMAANLKGAGLEHSAEVRDILGLRTPKELETALAKANKMTPGVEVVDPLGKTGVVTSNAYGKIGVQYPDGGTGTFPRKDVKVLNSKAESITNPNPDVRKMSDLQAESAASSKPATAPEPASTANQPSLDMPSADIPTAPPTSGSKVRNPKARRQAGQADVKVLGAVAGAGAALAAAYYKDDIANALANANMTDTAKLAAKMGLGAALSTAVFSVTRKVGTSFAAVSSDPFRYVLDPRSVEKLSPKGAFQRGLKDILSTNDVYKLTVARASAEIEKTAKKLYGKRPLKDAEFAEWNTKYRDHVEANVASGKSWDDGIPDKFKEFAKGAIKQMDALLDKWESLGGRISVTNDNTQHLKMNLGSSIKLDTGEWATYIGYKTNKKGQVILKAEVDLTKSPQIDPLIGTPVYAKDAVGGQMGKVVREIKPGDEFGRPVYRMGEAYVPRIYTRTFIDQLINADTHFRDGLNKSLVSSGASPLTDAEFASLKDMARGFAGTESVTDINSFMGNLQKERQLKLAKFEYVDKNGKTITVDPYENSYIDAVNKYMDRAAKRVAIADVLGVDSDVLAKVLDGVRSVDYDGANYLTTLVGRTLDLGPKASNYKTMIENLIDKAAGRNVNASDIPRAVSQYQTLTKMTGGTTAVMQFSDIIVPLTETGGTNVTRAVYRLVKDKSFRSDIDVFNGATQAYLNEMKAVENTGNKVLLRGGKIIDNAMVALLVKQMDKTAKRINTASIVTQAEVLMKKMEAGKVLSDAELRAAGRYGLTDYISEIRSKGVEEVMKNEKFQANLAGHARTFQHTGAPEDLPLWMSSPVGSMVMRFKKPWYVATKNFLSSAMNEATNGNFTPLARMVGWSVAVGSGAQYMKEIIKMSGLDEETRKFLQTGKYVEAIKRFFVDVPTEKNYVGQGLRAVRDEGAGGLMQLVGMIGQTIYESGATGAVGEVTPLNQRSQSDIRRFDLLDAIRPIDLQTGQRLFGIGTDTVNAILGDKSWGKANANTYETLRSEVLPARRLFDFLNIKPEEVVRRERNRTIKAENAKIPKDTYRRRDVLKQVAPGEKIDRRYDNKINKYDK